MKIKTRLLLSVLLAGILLVGVSISAIITNILVEKALQQETIAIEIAEGANELSYLSNDFLIYRENQQLARWQSRYTSFAAQVSSLQAYKSAQQAPIRNIQISSQRIKEVFDDVASTVVSSSPGQGTELDPVFLQVSWSRMAVQSQSLVSEAAYLSQLYSAQVDQLRRANLIAVYAMIFVFMAYIIISFLILQRRVLKSLAHLQTGVEVIGSGNLDYRTEVRENDEIGGLSRSFNKMAADLKSVTASKSDLELEIAWRAEVEEELRISNEQLQEQTRKLEEEIDERKKVEKALQRSEQRFRMVFESIQEAFVLQEFVRDDTGKIIDLRYLEVNPVAEKLLGKSRAELVGRTRSEVLGPMDSETTELINRVTKGETAKTERYIPSTGRWLESFAYSPQPDQMASLNLDITERKKAEAEISHLASFPELNPNPVIEIDNSGNILYANPAARTRFPDLFEQNKQHPLLAGWESVVGKHQTSSPLNRDVKVGDFWFLQTISYVPLEKTYRIYSRDITDRRQAIEDLRQRTAELEISNQELESFSYTVSHDLRAPLRSMDGFSQVLLEDYADKLDAQGKQWLQSIRNASQRMAELIDDILGLSRVVRKELKFEQADLSEMAESIAHRLKTSAPARRMEFSIAPGIQVWGDSGLLRIALENLLGNAFKFTAQTEPARIEFGVEQKNGKRIFFIRDNGVGFDMKYANKLFKPFQRLHSDKDYPGTGIGLVTIERIMKRHGGQVWAEGNVDKGATFYFTLG